MAALVSRLGALVFVLLAAVPSAQRRPSWTPAQMDSARNAMAREMDSVNVARGAVEQPPGACGLFASGLRFVLLACDSSAQSALVPPGRASALVHGGGGHFRMERLMRILAARSGRSAPAFTYVSCGAEFTSAFEPLALMDTSGGGWALAQRPVDQGVLVLCRTLDRGRWRAPRDSVVITPRDLLLLGTRMGDRFYVAALDAPALARSRDPRRVNRSVQRMQAELYGEGRAWGAAHPGPAVPRMMPGPPPASAGPFTDGARPFRP